MAIILDQNSKIIVQGMTGSEGMKHTQRMLDSGTAVVGGVNPRKAGTTVDFNGGTTVPVYGSVKETVEATGANVSVIFVPAKFTKSAVMEAVEAGGERGLGGDNPDLDVRLDLYRRLAQLTTKVELEGFAAELIDRFGPLPREVNTLLLVIRIKAMAKRANIAKLDAGPKGATVQFHGDKFADPAGLLQFLHDQKGAAKIKDNKVVLTASKASVFGIGVPDDLAQQLITAVADIPTPKGLTASDLKMTDEGISLRYSGQNVLPKDIESGSDVGATSCSVV